jgi:flagellar hook-basal body complex protein FliE
MIIESVAFLAPTREIVGLPNDAAATVSTTDFSGWLDAQLQDVNQQIKASDTQLRSLALGQTENLHQVMMSLEKAKLSFELVAQVRNRMLEAYQDIMRMQI